MHAGRERDLIEICCRDASGGGEWSLGSSSDDYDDDDNHVDNHHDRIMIG